MNDFYYVLNCLLNGMNLALVQIEESFFAKQHPTASLVAKVVRIPVVLFRVFQRLFSTKESYKFELFC